MNCATVTSVTIPKSVTWIGPYAFKGCSLTSVNIPDNVTSIGEEAFSGCGSLTSVTIPGSVTSIGLSAFYVCSSLIGIDVDANNPTYSSQDGVLYNKAMTELIQCPGGKTGAVIIPGTVTSIWNDAFRNSRYLTNISLPGSVTSISLFQFDGCTALTSIDVDSSNPNYSSQDGVLYNKAQTELIRYPYGKTGDFTIPVNVTSIGYHAFYASNGLTSVTIPGSITSIDWSAFSRCTHLTSATIMNGVSSIGWGMFSYCPNLASVTIPSSVTNIDDYAFLGCSGLTSITIPNSVTSIGEAVFGGCTALNSIILPGSVNSIGNDAFRGCTGLTTVTIADGVASIGEWAFLNCTALTSITIPASVASIGWDAFWQCNALTSINIDVNNPNYSSQDGVFYDKNKTTLLQYPAGKNGTQFTIPDTVTDIEGVAFWASTGLISVTIPASITSIGFWSFWGCSGLTAAYFYGNAPSRADDGVFANCASGFTVYYLAGATGFTNPWHGYPTAIFDPLPTTTTTTTTTPAEDCSVEFFPRRLSKVMNTVTQLQAFIIRGDENSLFSKATTIDWGTASVETLIKSALNKRLIIALVLVNGNNLVVGDIHEVNVDNCTGELPVKMF